MTKRILFILLALVLAISISLIGCAGGQQEEEEEEEEEEVELTLIFSDHNPEPNAMAQALTTYAEYIKNHSDGKVDYEIYYGESLLGQQAVFEGLQTGTADAANYVPEIGDGLEYMQVMSMPFMGWPSREAAVDIYWDLTETYPEIEGQLPSSLVFPTIYLMPMVHLHYYASDLTVDEPEDLSGMVINAMEGNLVDILDAIGGEGTGSMLTFPEVMSGIPTGIGDGFAQHSEFCAFFSLLSLFHSHTFFEGGVVFTGIGVLWNKDAYDETVELVGQDVMDAAHAAWLTKAYQGTAVDTALAYDEFTENAENHFVVSLDTAEIEENGWVDAASPYINDWIDSCEDPAKAQEIYDAAKAAIAAWTPPAPPGP